MFGRQSPTEGMSNTFTTATRESVQCKGKHYRQRRIKRAVSFLMRHLSMSNADAIRLLQHAAVRERKSVSDVARDIIDDETQAI
jgi:AmiR/NasT family two-component response regulator